LSDQDFFFDDEEADDSAKTEDKKPAAKTGSASKPAPKVAAKPAPKPAEKAEQAAPAESGSFFDQNVTMAMAALIAVIALLVGVIGGFLLGGSNAATEVPTSSAVTPGATTAPQLTPEQGARGPSGDRRCRLGCRLGCRRRFQGRDLRQVAGKADRCSSGPCGSTVLGPRSVTAEPLPGVDPTWL
jgi:hypothetical protein